MCTVLQPPGGYPIAVNRYIITYHINNRGDWNHLKITQTVTEQHTNKARHSIGLGVRGLWVSMFDVFWILFGVVLGAGFLASGFHFVCVCVCVCGVHEAWRILCICRRDKTF